MGSAAAEKFAATYAFSLDPFQVTALDALERGESVLVAAPTGSGKTVVGEFAVWLSLQTGGKAFYTTPLKALSNQKFGDLIALHGADNVGLLTGDNSINGSAPVVVMTTEVLRNMIYERSELLADLRYVILDEVHYLQDRYRGAVWEEVIIHLPKDVKIVSLSATVSNAEEFAEWIQTLRGTTTTVIEEKRPIELEHHYLIDDKLHPMFVKTDGEMLPNPNIRKMEARRHPKSPSRGRRPPVYRGPRRSDLVELLDGEGMLPAIYFIFSRKGCAMAVVQCIRDGLSLTDSSERRRIREYAEMRCGSMESSDLVVLRYDEWVEALASGFASHHAGMIPAFKETVEELFQAGLVKVVFATETLSLGINMPARTVVIESLTKFSGEKHELLTPGQFTQLTGRAGRRGIDVMGHAVVPKQREVAFAQIAGLASTRTYQLVSSFQPSYNMATNLVRNYSKEQSSHLLNSSFAQYRTDKDVVVLERLIERNEGYIASYRERSACHLGSMSEYTQLRDEVSRLERAIDERAMARGREETRRVLLSARPGEVLVVPSGRARGRLLVLGSDHSKRGEPRILGLNASRRILRLGAADLSRPPKRAGRIQLAPKEMGGWSSPQSIKHETRRRLAGELSRIQISEVETDQPDNEEGEREAAEGRVRMESHPCHSCPDLARHWQWAERAQRLEKENASLDKRIRSRTETLSRRFEKVLDVLEGFGYVEGFSLTDKGAKLARIYNENDLLAAEVLDRGWLDGLEPAELASIVSTFVYESRGPVPIDGTLPTAASKRVYSRIVRLEDRMKHAEQKGGLELIRGTETGFVETAYRWCDGAPLEEMIDEDSPPGDFIRGCKQTIDLLQQLIQVAPDPYTSEALESAVDGLNRGVVAYAGSI
ncbi:MAG TPA: DEAD/DEAH box helicase [Actinomycetota bacterium]|nr:DEAD/DEAH box helicase [Actinomycetota bacterium]